MLATQVSTLVFFSERFDDKIATPRADTHPPSTWHLAHHSRRAYRDPVLHSDSTMEQTDGAMEVQNMYQICQKSASYETGICFHSRNPQKPPERISYRELWDRAKQDAPKIERLHGITPRTIFLLHFDRHHYSIRWLWAVIAAGYVPAISPPLSKDIGQRKQHLSHISKLLREPIVLTTEDLKPDFQGQKHLSVYTVESYHLLGGSYSKTFEATHSPAGDLKKPDELAFLMFTSGSSGNCKAVCLRQGQILHALKGKIARHQTKQDDRFLNYIGLDHVANLTEIHLHAMYLGAEQTHIGGSGIIREPLLFLRLIHEYRISYSFATKSLLACLVPCLKDDVPYELDLSCLKALVTGGDAAPISTCTSIIEMLRSYGVLENFFQPVFGMTETCAGCTYNKACPEYEQNHNLEYASQGNTTQAISMRVVSGHDNEALEVPNGEKGSLQLRGSAVFSEYFNEPQDTKDSFTSDGWFKTGDDAIIYPDGHLVVVGRAKEAITINGKRFIPLDFETAVEKAEIPGITPSYTVGFAYRHPVLGADFICMLYVPQSGYVHARARARITDAIGQECFKLSGDVPFDVLAVDKASLPKSSLGKISRVKTQKAWESGAFFKFRGSASV